MQHVEEAGIHSGDCACVLPPHSLGAEMLDEIREADARDRARRSASSACSTSSTPSLGDDLYVIEANPRASRTVPFVSQGDRRAAGQARLPGDARRAARATWTCPTIRCGDHVSVKEAVLPFDRFDGADALLGPEMRSTGEVMGVAARLPDRVRQGPGRGRRARCPQPAPCSSPSPTRDKPARLGSPQHAARPRLPDRRHARHGRGDLSAWGSRSSASTRSARARPHVVDWIENGDVDLVINTPTGTARAHRRLGDPPRGGRPRHPVHHDALRRAGGGARDRRAARSGEPERALAAGAPRGARRGAADGAGPATATGLRRPRPASRRSAAAGARSDAARTAPTPCSTAADPDGPRPGRRPVLHARRGRALGRGRGRAAVPAAGVLRPARGATGALEFLLEDVGPGTERLCELGARRRRCWSLGPLGRGFAPPREGRARCSSAAASASPRWRSGGDRLRRGAARRCSASATPPTPRARRCSRERARRHRRRLGRPPRASSPTCSPSSSTTATRGLRLRAAADARGRARAARARRARAARAGVRHGLRVRRLLRLRRRRPADGYVRLCVDGPV